jgi:DNA-binding winged helix-turn-helix (wHTH) protein
MQMLRNAPLIRSDSGVVQPVRPPVYFGRLVLHPMERRLECDGLPVRISSRAFDILDAMLEQPGEIISHRDLIARAWPGISVTETNLRVHISALRRVLASKTGLNNCITNVPSRGYALTMPACPHESQSRLSMADISLSPVLCRGAGGQILVGRNEEPGLLGKMACAQGLASIVRMVGTGKTLLTFRLIDELRDPFGDAYFVDLSSVVTADDLLSSLSKVLKCGPDVKTVASTLENLRARNAIIVFDLRAHGRGGS